MHLVRRRWNQLLVGEYVKLKNDPRIWEITMKIGGSSFVVEDGDGDQKEVVFAKDYEASLLASDDCIAAAKRFEEEALSVFKQVWSLCEQHYGISHLGSSDPDPLRDLAFKILKGDPQALDAARDILKC